MIRQDMFSYLVVNFVLFVAKNSKQYNFFVSNN